MSGYFEFDDVETFTAGALGQPGSRTFLLQARGDGRRVTLKCEKQQVGALAQYLRQLLSDLPAPNDLPLAASLELLDPADPEFVVGPMSLGYAREIDRFVFTAEELVDAEEEGEEPEEPVDDRGRLRLYLTRSQALAFALRSDDLMAQSRPTCQFCGLPIDPDGHPCPRMN
jgi:uncharacterized repeat protein (TIGR03847 family)